MKRILILCLFPGLFTTSFSQDIERKTYETKFTAEAPVIDGLMNDRCWESVDWGGNFIQTQPDENKPPSQQTEFKILYDDDNLYVFIRANDTEPEKISRIITRRDYFSGDMVEVNLDSYYDQQTAFSFTAMASGAKGDEAITQNGNNWDDSWNPIWYLATSIDDKGWNAEMRIPLSQLRFANKTDQVWGMQLMRHIYRLEERSTWQFILKGSPGMVHLFGELDQKTLALTFRVNLPITPELTLEYYGQPFISAGNYSDFKRITDTHAEKFTDRYHVFTSNEIKANSTGTAYLIDENSDGIDDYSIYNPNFNFQQFRSNLVLRWEYLPGSIVYLVWSQGRTNQTSEGIFSVGDNMKDLFDIVPHNIFLVKLSYWFAL